MAHVENPHDAALLLPVIDSVVVYGKAPNLRPQLRTPAADARASGKQGEFAGKEVDCALGGFNTLSLSNVEPNLIKVGNRTASNPNFAHRFGLVLRSSASLFFPRA